jgi:hypothetical protein
MGRLCSRRLAPRDMDMEGGRSCRARYLRWINDYRGAEYMDRWGEEMRRNGGGEGAAVRTRGVSPLPPRTVAVVCVKQTLRGVKTSVRVFVFVVQP